MNNEVTKKLASKFFNDPDWALVEDMIREYIEPLRDLTSIDMNRSNDEVASEIRGRQIAYKQLSDFLRDSRLAGKVVNNTPITFK